MAVGRKKDRILWFVTGLALAGAGGYAAKRFMDPHDPPGLPAQAGPAPGSQFVGRKFEPFRLRGVDGKTVDSAAQLGRRPAIVVFHGGRESPFSTSQVAHLGTLPEVAAAHALVYVISIDSPADMSRMVHRAWRRQGVTEERRDFVFVGDDYGSFSRPYVGTAEQPNPALPASLNRATFVIGKDRRILYAYVNATPKLHPPEKEMLAALAKARDELAAAPR